MADVAWFVGTGSSRKHGRKRTWFDAGGWHGTCVVDDVLERDGINTGTCSAGTAKDYKVVLVPIVSVDAAVADWLREVMRHPDWQPDKREFKVIVGGCGVLNVYPYRDYADFAVFGRAENVIDGLVDAILGGADTYEHPSVMNLPDIHSVEFAQANEFYPYEIELTDGHTWEEEQIGCPHNCYFCHYSWVRQHVGDAKDGFRLQKPDENVRESTIWSIWDTWDGKGGHIRFAIDGSSERLRYAFNKPISNERITDTIHRLSAEVEGSTGIIPEIFNVGSFPTETDEDRREIENVFRGLQP